MRNIKITAVSFTLKWLAAALFPVLFAAPVFAHGGEDHGDEKPKTATTAAGTISRSARLGDFEIMFKHPTLEPDQTATGRLFITKFSTNEPIADANPAIEIESATGAVTQIPVEKSSAAGSYSVKIPALPEGAYTVRGKTTGGGKTNTATFSGVEIAHREAAAENGAVGNGSWTRAALMAMLFLVALALLGGLAFYALRAFKNKPLGEKTVSA